MLSDENIHNTILHRPNTKSDRQPFLVPINESLYHSHPQQNTTTSNVSKVTTITNLKDLKSIGGGSRKSIRLLRPETLKRAIHDSCMAAAIGDLEWLKQSLLITNEIHFDKNGFATIHLASIHGRLNILKYLIEEQNMDPNLASQHGWRPIHLCINVDIGKRSVNCLKYLIEKGANINCRNMDELTPVHMAAAEGHFECLKTLLELKADPFAKDCRNHSPLDLATLWSHRNCAKLINSFIWHVDKKVIEEQESLMKRVQTQQVLKEIEQSHYSYYENKEESEKFFDKWLINQGFLPDDEIQKQAQAAMSNIAIPKTKKKDKRIVLSSFVSGKTLIENKKTEAAVAKSESENENAEKKKKSEQKKTPFVPMNHPKQWDYSTKAKESEYITNLDDFYPRDPYTLKPENIDLVMLNKELKGMSLEQVKEFMKKPIESKLKPVSKEDRPFYYKPKNIIDAQTKYKLDYVDDERRIDFVGMTLQNDPKLFQFKLAQKFVDKSVESRNRSDVASKNDNSSYGTYYNTKDTVNLIKSQLREGEEKKFAKVKDEKLDIVKRIYGEDLKIFMTDHRHGSMDQKYEKVFIL